MSPTVVVAVFTPTAPPPVYRDRCRAARTLPRGSSATSRVHHLVEALCLNMRQPLIYDQTHHAPNSTAVVLADRAGRMTHRNARIRKVL